MPAQPPCFHRLEEIFTALRAMTSTHLDRVAVEKLFCMRHVQDNRYAVDRCAGSCRASRY